MVEACGRQVRDIALNSGSQGDSGLSLSVSRESFTKIDERRSLHLTNAHPVTRLIASSFRDISAYRQRCSAILRVRECS